MSVQTESRVIQTSLARPADVGADVGAGAEATVLGILFALSAAHMMNDAMQSVIQAMYPLFRDEYRLDYVHIGLITLAFQLTASILQPLVGAYTDRRPLPYSLPAGMASTFLGLILLSRADTFPEILGSAALVGIGSAIFHPESSRVARAAAGRKFGFAQSLFQTGGNAGAAFGPLLAAFVVLPNGQHSVAWVAIIALLAVLLLAAVGRWYASHLRAGALRPARRATAATGLPRRQVRRSIAILLTLMFSKFVYISSLSTYLTFYLIEKFGVSVRFSQLALFVFLAAGALGVFLGGPIGDRVGRRYVIWGSIAGVLPFTLALPHVGLWATLALVVPIGLVLSSAFSAIVVYAQDLVPGRVGLIAGLFFGLAFGLGGLGAAALGVLADRYGIEKVYVLTSVLPALGLLAALLPDLDRRPPERTVAVPAI